MVKSDQTMRKGIRYNPKIDRKNTKRMKEIVRKYGWPKISMVGINGSAGAWLLVQHADHDIKFQEHCLRLLKEAANKKEAHLKYVAYLMDRIFVNKKRPQIFGTQFYLNKNGEMIPRKIKDVKNLSRRRKKFGFGSFQIYQKKLLNYYKRLR